MEVPSSTWRDRPGSTSQAASSPSGQGPAEPLDSPTEDTPWNASSTITLVGEAFHNHEAPSPQEGETSAFLASTWAHAKPRAPGQTRPESAPSPLQRMLSQHLQNTRDHQASQIPRSRVAEHELLSFLPDLEAAKILVDNYFDRIHWFMLVFHQRDFRNKFRSLYEDGPRPSDRSAGSNSRVGYIVVLLAVLATSLRYTSGHQKQLLVSHGVEPGSLEDKILTGLKLRFLDIISLGSLEVVQMCILLGSYYLYHGEPEMAWPLCGSGLRIAQALNLHRRVPDDKSRDPAFRQTIEDRKRVWWAIYEIETFCSMLYGFPSSIFDSDCDVSPLNPYDEHSGSTTEEQCTSKPNLLFFKCAMSKLSAIVKSALVDLYGARGSRDRQALNQKSRLKTLVNNVASLNSGLVDWSAKLTPKLKFDSSGIETSTRDQAGGSSVEPEAAFEEHLFRLQALALKLAYENARILVHRPLLSFRMLCAAPASQEGAGRLDPFQRAMHTCRDAALQISDVAATPYLREASETYAIAFVSLHLLTAAVTLCISISVDPLSWTSYESRMGIRRLMQIQNLLKDKSIVAAQGLDITKRLMSLVMAKEVDAMFDVGPPKPTTEQPTANASPQLDRIERQRTETELRDLEGSSIQATSQAPQVPDANPLPLENADLATEAISTLADGQFFDFCENSFMKEAVIEYEKAITDPFGPNPVDEPIGFGQPDTLFGNTSLGQEQGWIWGWNFLG
ncbi:hypothetical protein ACJZ2D_009049 [Fusarium nematophilum]